MVRSQVKSRTIGVTGPSGAGKSEVCKVLQQQGYQRINVDKLAKSLYKKGNPGYRRVLSLFGKQILGPRGEVDRKKLAVKVFHDVRARKSLNQALFPLINKAIQKTIYSKQRIGRRKFCLDMAVLFHSHTDRLCDNVILVLDSKVRREARLRKRGLDVARVKAQASSLRFGSAERQRASLVIHNRGTRSQLRNRVLSFLSSLLDE